MRQFGIISSSIWRSRRFRQLTTDAARLTYLYLHTTTHGNSAGAFVMPPEMAALEMKVPSDKIQDAFMELAASRLIRYDPDEELIQIANFFKFNSISSRKHLQGPVRIIRSLPKSPVRDCAACDLILAMFERREEWRDKAQRLQKSETRTDHTEAGKILEAMGGFDTTAADMIKEMHLETTLASEEIGLDKQTLEQLSDALLIPLSHTPIDTPIDITDTEKNKEKDKTTETEKTKITDKTTDRGSGGKGRKNRPPASPADSGRSGGISNIGDEALRQLRERLAQQGGT